MMPGIQKFRKERHLGRTKEKRRAMYSYLLKG